MTNTDICNIALSYLAKNRITSVDDNTEEAKQCKIHYDHCRHMLLRSYTWGFAKKVEQLALLDTKVPGWLYAYGYPQKCLSIRLIFSEGMAEFKESRKEQFEKAIIKDNTRAILTNVENAWCEFTYDATDADMFSEEFIEALARLLASSMAMQLTGNGQIQATQYQLYQVAAQNGMVAATNEREKKTSFPTDYANTRFMD